MPSLMSITTPTKTHIVEYTVSKVIFRLHIDFIFLCFSFVDIGKCQPVFGSSFDCVPGKNYEISLAGLSGQL